MDTFSWVFYVLTLLVAGSIFTSNLISWGKRDSKKCPPSKTEKNIYYTTLIGSGLVFLMSGIGLAVEIGKMKSEDIELGFGYGSGSKMNFG